MPNIRFRSLTVYNPLKEIPVFNQVFLNALIYRTLSHQRNYIDCTSRTYSVSPILSLRVIPAIPFLINGCAIIGVNQQALVAQAVTLI